MDKLVWCDYLIFNCPLHWFGLPTVIKGWCDKVLARGFAYGSGAWYDTGKFLGKKALLCMTTGGPENMYKADHIQGDIRDITYPITHGIFWFCGFTPLQSHFVYGPGYASEDQRAQHLAQYREKMLNIHKAPTIRYRGFADVVSQHKQKEVPSPVMKYQQKCFCGAVESGSNGKCVELSIVRPMFAELDCYNQLPHLSLPTATARTASSTLAPPSCPSTRFHPTPS
jgi:hypothetical protein